VSADEQKKGMGPDMQRTRTRALCEARGWQLGPELEDLGKTGRDTKRPGLQELLRSAEAGEIGAVCVYRLDRLSRKAGDLLRIWERLDKCGVALASATESVDTSTPLGRAMMGMCGVFAQMESEVFQERTSDGRREKAQQGGFSQAVRGFGFEWDKGDKAKGRPKRPYIVEHEALIVADVFAYAAGGMCPEEIAHELDRRDVARRGGGKWRNPEVQKILANPAYMGRFVTFTDPETGEETLAKPELCPPAIVDAVTWQAAQAVTRAYHKAGRRKLKRTFLLSGFCTCGVCGRRLTIRKPTFEHSYYACNGAVKHENGCDLKHIPAGDLDADVWAQIIAWAAQPEVLRRSAQDTQGELLPRWHRELVRVGEQMKHWQTRLRTGREKVETPGSAYTDEDFAATKGEYGLHMSDLAAEAEGLEAKIAAAETRESGVDWAARTLAAAGDLDSLDQDAKRRLLSALGAKVTVRTFTDEKGRLASWDAELDLFTSLATSNGLP
jgi:DNA invertase Pin-like site-specific DNA recombinase